MIPEELGSGNGVESYGCHNFLSGNNPQDMDTEMGNSIPVTSMNCRDGDQSLGRLRWQKFCGQNAEKEGAEQQKCIPGDAEIPVSLLGVRPPRYEC